MSSLETNGVHWAFDPNSTGRKRVRICPEQCRNARAHASGLLQAAVSSLHAVEEDVPPLPRKKNGATWPPEVRGKVFRNGVGQRVRITKSGKDASKLCMVCDTVAAYKDETVRPENCARTTRGSPERMRCDIRAAIALRV